jgi:hypothetical protein
MFRFSHNPFERTNGLCRSNKRAVESDDTKPPMNDPMKTLNPALAKELKRLHYPLEVILTCVRDGMSRTRLVCGQLQPSLC